MEELKKFIVDVEDTLTCDLKTENKCDNLNKEERETLKKLW